MKTDSRIYADLVDTRLSRRAALLGLTSVAALAGIGGLGRTAVAAQASSTLTFAEIAKVYDDNHHVAEGYKADLNIIDLDHLRLHAPHIVYDLPAGGRRLKQNADGYEATIVSGEITYRNGLATGALPGRLVRGAQAAPRATRIAA